MWSDQTSEQHGQRLFILCLECALDETNNSVRLIDLWAWHPPTQFPVPFQTSCTRFGGISAHVQNFALLCIEPRLPRFRPICKLDLPLNFLCTQCCPSPKLCVVGCPLQTRRVSKAQLHCHAEPPGTSSSRYRVLTFKDVSPNLLASNLLQ